MAFGKARRVARRADVSLCVPAPMFSLHAPLDLLVKVLFRKSKNWCVRTALSE